tara:strand:+ start:298 stop:714 length:417 start_codon:yes stop_codon:yes gene_type:complete
MENLLFFYPALLFPAIPLMMISFGNRYTAVSTLIRKLHGDFIKEDSSTKDNKIIYEEIINLRIRLRLIRTVQTGSGLAFMSNLVSIFFSYSGNIDFAFNTFGLAVIIFLIVIAIFIAEIQLSSKSLNLHLSAMINNKK